MSSLLEAVREAQVAESLSSSPPNNPVSGIEVAKFVIDFLRSQELVAGVAGGYPRDVMHGVTPKDIDVVCSSEDNLDDSEYFAILEELSEQILIKWDTLSTYCHEAYEETDSRISCVLKLTGADLEVDVIFYRLTYGGLIGITDQFDCNLNQYVLGCITPTPVFVGDKHPHAGLVFIADDLTEERKEKMRLKWESFYGKAN